MNELLDKYGCECETKVRVVTGSESSCCLSEAAIERLSKISSIPLDPDMAKILSDHLWELI